MAPERRVALLLTIVAPAFAPACRAPTEAIIEIVGEVSYRPDMTVAVQIAAAASVEDAPARVTTRERWTSGGTIGTVVAVPSGDRDEVVVRVVVATGREPATCSRSDPSGCIVVRRRVRFTRSESQRVRVVLRPACIGVFCDASSSCAIDGACGSLDSDEASGDAGAEPASGEGSDAYSTVVLADRPRHYFRLDEPDGARIAKDSTGRADGAYEGAVKLGVTGALATSTATGAFFDGASAAVVVAQAEDIPGSSSVEAWVRSDGSAGAAASILERVDALGESGSFGFRVLRQADAAAAFEIFRGESTYRAAARPPRFAGYTHLVAVTRAADIALYVDGALSSTSPIGSTPASTVLAPLLIGASRAGASSFRGAIDEVAIYDYPLALDQIRRHHEVGAPQGGAP